MAASEYTYYGYVPEALPNSPLPAYVSIIGYDDQTDVRIYDLVDGSLIAEFAVDRMQLIQYNITEANKFLKIVTDKRVSAFLCGGLFVDSVAAAGIDLRCFSLVYPSTLGTRVGDEFIVCLLHEGQQTSLTKVFAWEDAEIKILDKDENTIQELSISQLETREIILPYREPIRVSSTGRLMIASWGTTGVESLPSDTGMPVGKSFASIGRIKEALSFGFVCFHTRQGR